MVSHQHRYGEHYRKVKEIVASGALGRVHTVYGSATGWMTHMLSHLIDYTCWFNQYTPATWVMAQAAGRSKLTDNHPSPDYIGGFVQFANGVRGIYECGAGAPDQPEVAKWWGKNRIGAQGTEGFAEVLTNGGWRAVTKTGGYQTGEGAMNYDLDMPPYIQEMADWLDDDRKPHPAISTMPAWAPKSCSALQRSAAEGGQVALPFGRRRWMNTRSSKPNWPTARSWSPANRIKRNPAWCSRRPLWARARSSDEDQRTADWLLDRPFGFPASLSRLTRHLAPCAPRPSRSG